MRLLHCKNDRRGNLYTVQTIAAVLCTSVATVYVEIHNVNICDVLVDTFDT